MQTKTPISCKSYYCNKLNPLKPAMNLRSNPTFDEHRWVIQIRRALDYEDLEDDNDTPVCIFNVPKSLMSINPDSYTPQQVAIGPYHYWRPELYEMERYKLAAAKRAQKNLPILNFQNLVDQLTLLEPRIRASYHKYLDFNGETLAWMMALDASFLLEFLQIYEARHGKKVLRRVNSKMSHLLDHAGRKSAHNMILRDIVMLENQIPLIVLRKILELQFLSLESADELLVSMLSGLCEELSPFNKAENLPQFQISHLAHLLDFLYQMIVPNLQDPLDQSIAENPEIDQEQEELEESQDHSSRSLRYMMKLKQLLDEIWIQFVDLFKRAISSKPVKLLMRLPWIIISNLPFFAILKPPVESLLSIQDQEMNKPSENESININKPPLVEEITIPSVTELSNSGVSFLPTNGDISSIGFDIKTVTLWLPVISLDVNTEVTLRNLVAYEASNASGALVFTRYTELMNGIIDTVEDVKILRRRGIILNRLKSDEEVAKLWNGMSKSIRLTKVPFLDKVIEDANKYYDGRLKVKIEKFMKLYVFDLWQFLILVAAIMLLFLVALQGFYFVYSCNHMVHSKTK